MCSIKNVLGRIFKSKVEELTEGRRKPDKEELHTSMRAFVSRTTPYSRTICS
jgi:hypothetical protein